MGDVDAERQFWEAVVTGDRQAQRLLYTRYAGAAMAVAMRYVADSDRARDVLHDAFVKILTAVGRIDYRGEGALRSWIMRVVANESVDFLKRERRFVWTDSVPEDVPDEQGDDPPDGEPDVGALPPGLLQQAIEQLPTGYRTVLNLYVFEQQSHREIARRLGIGEKTSASQFLRAKRLLAKLIKQQLNGDNRQPEQKSNGDNRQPLQKLNTIETL